MGRPVLSDTFPGHPGPGPPRSRSSGLWPEAGAHLGVAAPELEDAVADGQKQLHDAVRVPALGLHQGLAQGQPHLTGQEVLAVLPRGPAGQEATLGYPQGASACPSVYLPPRWTRASRGNGLLFLRLASLALCLTHSGWADRGEAARKGREQGSLDPGWNRPANRVELCCSPGLRQVPQRRASVCSTVKCG